MATDQVVITCLDCGFEASFPTLGQARPALDNHESASGHTVDWQINRVAPGVEQAGADAGICGISGCENPDSALISYSSVETPTHNSAGQQDGEPDGEIEANGNSESTESDTT